MLSGLNGLWHEAKSHMWPTAARANRESVREQLHTPFPLYSSNCGVPSRAWGTIDPLKTKENTCATEKAHKEVLWKLVVRSGVCGELVTAENFNLQEFLSLNLCNITWNRKVLANFLRLSKQSVITDNGQSFYICASEMIVFLQEPRVNCIDAFMQQQQQTWKCSWIQEECWWKKWLFTVWPLISAHWGLSSDSRVLRRAVYCDTTDYIMSLESLFLDGHLGISKRHCSTAAEAAAAGGGEDNTDMKMTSVTFSWCWQLKLMLSLCVFSSGGSEPSCCWFTT